MSTPDVESLDFDQLYQGNAEIGPAGFVPWDIGEPQPLLVEVEAAGELRGDLLDAGCGLADNALFLGGRGYRVTGIDASPTAIDRARAKARDRGLDVEFAVADATRLDGLDDRFDTVLDSALYHCLNDDEQRAYVTALHRVCRPGATLHLFCRSELLGTAPGPRAVPEHHLRASFREGWEITRLERRTYTTAFTTNMLPEGFPTDVPQDEHGRFLMPVWQLTAVRRP
ncbi:class I SAM-dependent methyltransferase [Amycolatopsis sp. K13G38]|uniref:Class I SAM-dependent methyltransferase n=1 Tax=Amycolatopsis acididurans TaxID=2724524 RepID=A0ABX1J0E3_9PSEU|nr:class I SAM-dependent methyltransferase [Amycolatopsis acididurans]NKQ53084.1 class I SAM-dependent methyltransferase [Amycolatopsis acididurans]